MRVILRILGLIALLTTGCEGEFVPDPLDPQLPRYSEKGHNTAGALINGKIWRAVYRTGFLSQPSGTLSLWADTTTQKIFLTLEGNEGYDSSFIAPVHIEFVLDNTDNQLQRIESLKGKKFVLDGQPHFAQLTDLYMENASCKSSDGQLYIKNVKRTHQTEASYQISGTFGFTIDTDSCGLTRVQYGRFDYQIEGGLILSRIN